MIDPSERFISEVRRMLGPDSIAFTSAMPSLGPAMRSSRYARSQYETH